MYSITFDMSRWIVSQRPFSRKKRKQSIKKKLNRSGISIPEFNISQKLKNILSRWMLLIVLIIGGILILIKFLFLKPELNITKVKFSEDTQATYQNPHLFDFIVSEVKWKNYYALKSNKDELLSKIQNWFSVKNLSWQYIEFKFPFVWGIEFQLEPQEELKISEPEILTIWIQLPLQLPILNYQTTQTTFPLKLSKKEDEIWWTLWIQLLYYDPIVLIKLNDKEFAVWNENTYIELKEWMLLWIRDPWEEPLFVIETPMYLSGTTSLDWFFFDLTLSDFVEIIKLSKEAFPNMKRFVYLAWSSRIAIFTDDNKTLYFNFIKWSSIENQRNTQISKYNILKEKFTNFKYIRTIDLWALEDNKVIIKYY